MITRTWTVTLETDQYPTIDQVNRSLGLIAMRVASVKTKLNVKLHQTKQEKERMQKCQKNTTLSSSAKETPVKKTKRSDRKKVS